MNAAEGVVEAQRDRTLRAADVGAGPTGAFLEVGLHPADVSERGGHQQELRVGELDERHLPGPSTVGLRVVVELVHHHLADLGIGPLAKRDVGDDLGGRTDDRRIGVDRGVPGDHSHVLGAEHLAQREELLAHQGLDRRGVVAPHAAGHRGEMRTQRHQRLTGPRGGGQDDVAAGGDLEDRFLLCRVQLQAPVRGPRHERVVHRLVVEAGGNVVEVSEQIGQMHPSEPSRPASSLARLRSAVGVAA